MRDGKGWEQRGEREREQGQRTKGAARMGMTTEDSPPPRTHIRIHIHAPAAPVQASKLSALLRGMNAFAYAFALVAEAAQTSAASSEKARG